MRTGINQPKPVVMSPGWKHRGVTDQLEVVLDKLLSPKDLKEVKKKIEEEWGLQVEVVLCGNHPSLALPEAQKVVAHAYQLATPFYLDGAKTAISEIRTIVRKERIAELEAKLEEAYSLVERKLLVNAIAIARKVFVTAKQLGKEADHHRPQPSLDENGRAAKKARNREEKRQKNRERARAGDNGRH